MLHSHTGGGAGGAGWEWEESRRGESTVRVEENDDGGA
jgi:hypothetical protein